MALPLVESSQGNFSVQIRLPCAYKSLLCPGMVLTSAPVHSKSEVVRFETAQEPSILSSVLGELVTVGVRKRRPKHGIEKSLHVNDAINVVAGSKEREEPFLHRTSEQGIDLTFDGANHVRVWMRCQRFQCGDTCPSTILSRTIVQKIPLGGAESDETSSDDDSEDNDTAAKVGMEFEKDLVQCRIRSINALDGLATRLNPLSHDTRRSHACPDRDLVGPTCLCAIKRKHTEETLKSPHSKQSVRSKDSSHCFPAWLKVDAFLVAGSCGTKCKRGKDMRKLFHFLGMSFEFRS
jgi:hypothetical protein